MMALTRSQIMSRIRSKNTKPELLVRKRLRKLGFVGYRLHHGEFKIDVAFVGKKIAIFMDSCFWHGCPEHFRMPKTNVEFWKNKIDRNERRDREADQVLEKEGWKVVRIWEHQLKDLNELDNILSKVIGK